MGKEGEGGIKVEKRKGSSLQNATGQGKETEGIKYPYPAPHIIAFVEDEFGALNKMEKEPDRHGYRMGLMLVFYLEMQKRGQLKEIVLMTSKERKVASVEFFEKENIDMGNMQPYIKAADAVFFKALGARIVKKGK